jgi:hypothetical protein
MCTVWSCQFGTSTSNGGFSFFHVYRIKISLGGVYPVFRQTQMMKFGRDLNWMNGHKVLDQLL